MDIKKFFVKSFPRLTDITAILAYLLHACDGVMFDTAFSKVIDVWKTLFVAANVTQMASLSSMQFLVSFSDILVMTLFTCQAIYHVSTFTG